MASGWIGGGVPTTPKMGNNNKSGGGRKTKAAPKCIEDSDDMNVDKDSDNSTYNLSGGDEPARTCARLRSRAQRSGSVNGAGGNGAGGNGRNGSVSQDGQAGEGEVFYNAPEVASSNRPEGQLPGGGAVPGGPYYVGDIDDKGRYWISSRGDEWAQIDLVPGSATYGQVIQSGKTVPTPPVLDWAFIEGGGDYLYGIRTVDPALVRWSMATKQWETVRTYPSLAGINTFGAVYSAGGLTLYGSENRSGQIWRFPIQEGPAVFVSNGSASGLNDGARCALLHLHKLVRWRIRSL